MRKIIGNLILKIVKKIEFVLEGNEIEKDKEFDRPVINCLVREADGIDYLYFINVESIYKFDGSIPEINEDFEDY